MKTVYVYNTLTRQKEELKTITKGKINFFVCGPTVYDFPHLGHAKAYIQFDFIVKFLRYLGHDVFYLQNITNIDDKIIKRANEKGVRWEDLSREFENVFYEDMLALGVDSVTKYARATDYLPQIISQVKVLLEKGYAYQIGDGIYFEVSKFKSYGKLSGRTELKEDDGVSRIDENVDKRGWNDFCLWKFSKVGEPSWESDLGKGRPGWHIEDTAITESFFGPQYDIHGGGADLIFPHHEAEVSQMEAASGLEPLVRYWMHVGFLNVDSKKMGKSKGNFKTIRDVLVDFDKRVIRYVFLIAHYRSPVDFSEDGLNQAKNSLKRLDEFVSKIDWELVDEGEKTVVESTKVKIIEKLSDDFDTSNAMAILFDFIKFQNSQGKSGKYVGEFLQEIDSFLGFFSFTKQSIPEEVKKLAEQRLVVRKVRNWSESDRLRGEIEKLGYCVLDGEDDYRLEKLDS